jgi:hypothetical protein
VAWRATTTGFSINHTNHLQVRLLMKLRPVSQEEISFFHNNGWAYLPGLVDAGTVAQLHTNAQTIFREQIKLGEFL